MKKIMSAVLVIMAGSSSNAVAHQLTNTMDARVIVTIKEAIETDAEHAENSVQQTNYRIGETILAGPFTIDNGKTIDFNLPVEGNNPPLASWHYALVEWNAERMPMQNKQLLVVFRMATHYLIDQGGEIILSDESFAEIDTLLKAYEAIMQAPREMIESYPLGGCAAPAA